MLIARQVSSSPKTSKIFQFFNNDLIRQLNHIEYTYMLNIIYSEIQKNTIGI